MERVQYQVRIESSESDESAILNAANDITEETLKLIAKVIRTETKINAQVTCSLNRLVVDPDDAHTIDNFIETRPGGLLEGVSFEKIVEQKRRRNDDFLDTSDGMVGWKFDSDGGEGFSILD